MLTLPLAGFLKKSLPGIKIGFLCREYTSPVVRNCEHVDEVIIYKPGEKVKDYECALAVYPEKEVLILLKRSAIPIRVATAGRIYTFLWANKRVAFSRKKSDLHEAQLNFKLLKPLGFDFIPELNEIPCYYGLRVNSASSFFQQDRKKINLIIHPGSKGSARDWNINNYVELIRLIPQNRFNIFISGTQKEANTFLPAFDEVSDRFTVIPGAYGLDQFMGIIAAADVLLASSTGPLHLAAALNIHAIGIYVPMRPIHPGRWAPLGNKSEVVCTDKICGGCKKGEPCSCIAEISPEMVLQRLMKVEKVSSH